MSLLATISPLPSGARIMSGTARDAARASAAARAGAGSAPAANAKAPVMAAAQSAAAHLRSTVILLSFMRMPPVFLARSAYLYLLFE
jgi:hypothetical protein